MTVTTKHAAVRPGDSAPAGEARSSANDAVLEERLAEDGGAAPLGPEDRVRHRGTHGRDDGHDDEVQA